MACLWRRAVGGPWRATSPLPADAAPESEKRCELLGQPVHRFVASRRPRRGDRLRLFAAPRDDLDGGDADADVVLDAALTRVMHAGTYEFVEDTSEPNRVFLAADGRATANHALQALAPQALRRASEFSAEQLGYVSDACARFGVHPKGEGMWDWNAVVRKRRKEESDAAISRSREKNVDA